MHCMNARRVLPILLLSLAVSICPTQAAQDAVRVIRTPDDGIQPQAAIDAKGVIHLIYFKGDPKGGDIFYVRREPGEKEFSKPMAVNSQPRTAMALGTIR